MDSADDRVRQAIELAKTGKIEEARAELVGLVKADQDNAAAWAALAQLADTPRDAAYCLKQILRIQPDNEWARTHLQRLSGQEAQPDQTSQVADEAQQQPALPPAGKPPRIPIKVVLGTAGVLAILLLLGGLLFIRGGSPAGLFSPAAGETTLPANTTPSMAPTSGPVSTLTNTGPMTPLPSGEETPSGAEGTSQAPGGAVPTATPTAQINQATTLTLAPSPTPLPTGTAVLTPTDYPTATDPPQPADVPTNQPPPAAAPCDCYGASLTCRSFDTQAKAQACYDFCLEETGLDIFFLDSNHNDIACENLP